MVAIQARGALIAIDPGKGVVAASVNAEEFLGSEPLGGTEEELDREILHGLRNATVLPWIEERATFAGRCNIAGSGTDLYVHRSDGLYVVEFERAGRHVLPAAYDVARDVRLLAESGEGLSGLLQTLSGFDDVAVSDSTTFLGIEAASDILVLDDTNRTPVAIAGDPPNLSRAGLRQPDKLGALKNQGIRALTLARTRFGTVALSHATPRILSHRTRLVLDHLSMGET